MWLHSRNVAVRAQVEIEEVGRVDLLVGCSWVIELDSEQHHATLSGYHEDRRRDLQLRRHGYTVTRLTYQQVFHDWPRTEAALAEILRRRRHRRHI